MSQCGNNNELALQYGGFCTMWSFVAKGPVSISLWIKVPFPLYCGVLVCDKTSFLCFAASAPEYYTTCSRLSKDREIAKSFFFIHRLKHTSSFAGSYIYIEASKKNPGDEARLLSDDIEPNENVCVQFWYHLHGSDTGKLSIYVKTNQSETLVWRLSGDQGNRWRFGQTALNSSSLYKVSSHDYL